MHSTEFVRIVRESSALQGILVQFKEDGIPGLAALQKLTDTYLETQFDDLRGVFLASLIVSHNDWGGYPVKRTFVVYGLSSSSNSELAAIGEYVEMAIPTSLHPEGSDLTVTRVKQIQQRAKILEIEYQGRNRNRPT